MKNRRDFIRISAAGTVGTLVLGTYACGSGAKKPAEQAAAVVKAAADPGVGLILYTIRDAMAEDVPGSLKKVADLGYSYVEVADYKDGKFYGYAPAEFKKMVDDLGMVVKSSHAAVESTGISMDNAQKMADDHAILGVEYCIQPWVNDEDRTIDKFKSMVADWNQVGEVMQKAGIQFGYHNHNFEFKNMDGIVPYYDIYMKEMDPKLIIMELDIYWAIKGGQDPVEMFNKYPGRFPLWHMKDMSQPVTEPFYTVDKDDITSVGAGLIDYKRIFAAKETAGMKYYFVEDDNQGNGQPFEGIKISIDNIKSKILV